MKYYLQVMFVVLLRLVIGFAVLGVLYSLR